METKKKKIVKWEMEEDFFTPLEKLNFEEFKGIERVDTVDVTLLCFKLYGKFASVSSYLLGFDQKQNPVFRNKCAYDNIDDVRKCEKGCVLSKDNARVDISAMVPTTDNEYSFFLEDTRRIICTKHGIVSIEWANSNEHIELLQIGAFSHNGMEELKKYVSHTIKLADVPVVKRNRPTYSLVYLNQGRYTTQDLYPKDVEIDFKKNYNDDFDYERIKNLCVDEKTSLTLLHGKPGTGKSYMLRQLISDLTLNGHDVLYIDPSIISTFSDAQFFQFLLGKSGSTVIMEDCESLLNSRDLMKNPVMNTLLNLTDGIVGDSLKLHFICTFNTNLKNIDKALLRKGRLSYIYEFKPLTLEKTNELLPEATSPMTLGDIYNHNVDTGIEQSSGKFGFNAA